jgi:hypothetical protein
MTGDQTQATCVAFFGDNRSAIFYDLLYASMAITQLHLSAYMTKHA